MTATVLLAIAVVILGAALGVIGWAVRRQVNRNDEIMRTLSEHTVAIAQIATSLSSVTLAHTRMLDDIEDLDDAVDQLQLTTSRLLDRMAANERYRTARREGNDHEPTRDP